MARKIENTKISAGFCSWLDNTAFGLFFGAMALAFMLPATKPLAHIVGNVAVGMWVASFLVSALEWLANKVPFTRWEIRRFEAELKVNHEKAVSDFDRMVAKLEHEGQHKH